MGKGLLGPLVVPVVSLTWMLAQWEFYSMGGWTIKPAQDLGIDVNIGN